MRNGGYSCHFVNYSTDATIQRALDSTPWVPALEDNNQCQSDVVVPECEGKGGCLTDDAPKRDSRKLCKFRCEADGLDVSLGQSPFNVAAFRKRKCRHRLPLWQTQRLCSRQGW